MNRSILLLIMVVLFLPCVMFSQELGEIQLPDPQTDGGRPLMQVLQDRKSSREFSKDDIPLQTISDLLWSAFGVNRPESGKRTAPSAVNWQEIDIYVALAGGCYRYDAFENRLLPVLSEDVRALTGTQEFVADAPLNLVYVADFSRMGKATETQKLFFSATDVGFISQNVYLYCASEGLATVVRGMIDSDKLAKKLQLRSDQKILLGQTVGYPAE